MTYKQLKLENQLCFPLYAASRLIIREYQSFLDELGITYPQYLVLLVLWESDAISVNEIGKKLILNTNTITPLLKRMEKQELLIREKSIKDERRVVVRLTDRGRNMKDDALNIPAELGHNLTCGSLDMDDLFQLKDMLFNFINNFEK